MARRQVVRIAPTPPPPPCAHVPPTQLWHLQGINGTLAGTSAAAIEAFMAALTACEVRGLGGIGPRADAPTVPRSVIADIATPTPLSTPQRADFSGIDFKQSTAPDQPFPSLLFKIVPEMWVSVPMPVC